MRYLKNPSAHGAPAVSASHRIRLRRFVPALRLLSLAALVVSRGWCATPAASPLVARVVSDQSITTTLLPDNGANALWAYGAPLLARQGEIVWASIAATDPEAEPYCNTHWELWRSASGGAWERVRSGPAATEREPCPIGLVDRDTLVLSANPRVLQHGDDPSGHITWFCQPVVPVFNLRDMDDNDDVAILAPVFNPGATFRQHSYRGLAVDKSAREMLLLMIDGDHYQPAWYDFDGRWHPMPVLRFPIRACYPQVSLGDRVAHVLVIGDILETNPVWKREKFRVLQRDWDYVYRRLFHAWTPDVTGGFESVLEIESVEDTAGYLRNCDLLVDDSGRAHVLYYRRSIQYAFLRDRFFPGEAMTDALVHVVIDRGQIVGRATLLTRGAEPLTADPAEQRPWIGARLHKLGDGRLLAVYALDAPDRQDRPAGLFLQQLAAGGGAASGPVRVPLAETTAFSRRAFFTNTPRGGSDPGGRLDLLGADVADQRMILRHVSLQIE